MSSRTARRRLPTPGSPSISTSRYRLSPITGSTRISMIQGTFMAVLVCLLLSRSTTRRLSTVVMADSAVEYALSLTVSASSQTICSRKESATNTTRKTLFPLGFRSFIRMHSLHLDGTAVTKAE